MARKIYRPNKFTVMFTDIEATILKELCQQDQASVSEIIRAAVREYARRRGVWPQELLGDENENA